LTDERAVVGWPLRRWGFCHSCVMALSCPVRSQRSPPLQHKTAKHTDCFDLTTRVKNSWLLFPAVLSVTATVTHWHIPICQIPRLLGRN
jgi:hypothetical protein